MPGHSACVCPYMMTCRRDICRFPVTCKWLISMQLSGITLIIARNYLVRPLRTLRVFRGCMMQSSVLCRLVQLLHGKPMTAASHLILRARQGRQALFAVTDRLPLSRCTFFCSPPEILIEERQANLSTPAISECCVGCRAHQHAAISAFYELEVRQ